MTQEEKRTKFHEKLKTIVPKVYFNPSESKKLEYPCIVYSMDDISTKHYSNGLYIYDYAYKVILIGIKPYDDEKDKIMKTFKYCSFNTSYVKDNLYHYVYTIYDNQ